MGHRRKSIVEPAISVMIHVTLAVLCITLMALIVYRNLGRLRPGQLSRKDTKREAKLEEEYHEKFTKMRIAEQKDVQKLQKLQEEHNEKIIKSKKNQFNNEESYVCRIVRTERVEEMLDGSEMTFRPMLIETVKAKDITDQSRDLCKKMFPKAYLEVPDYDLSMQREHKMLHYQIHLWKRKRSNNFVNLN